MAMKILEYSNEIRYPRRKHPHHRCSDSTNSNLPIFLTVCTKRRSSVLAHELAHDALRDLWSDNSRWIVGLYVLMPEHAHLIVIEAARNRTPLSMWIGWWKQQASARGGGGGLVWQRDFWDTTIRTQAMFAEKSAYIKNNPVKRGLVHAENEWPFQGEVYCIGL
jgi:REP element-mobilizing transposase RayT